MHFLSAMVVETLIYTLLSVVVVSLISFVGIFMLSFRKDFLERILLFLVSFAVGALIGDAFLHLMPEAITGGTSPRHFGAYALMGIIIFFTIEKFLRWHHRHLFTHREEKGHYHPYIQPFVWMNLIGDGVHNFIDGMVIAGSYIIDTSLGITTTLAVVLHEIPQEIGDFGVLIKGGLSRGKALFFNFLSALTAVLGGLITLFVGTRVKNLSSFLVPFTFGGFLYLALVTLVPELHHQDSLKQLVVQLLGIGLGIGIMASMLLVG